MEQQLEELRARLESLARELAEVQRRLDALEARVRLDAGADSTASADGIRAVDSAQPAEGALVPPWIPAKTIALIGRTLVVLGGAYLLRAVSETGAIPALAGAAAGLAYAAWWLVAADRAAVAGQRLSAFFHGFAAVMVADPLIWETTARFALLGAPAAAAALVTFAALGLAVSWRRELRELAWTVTLFALATALVLALGSRQFLPYGIALLLIAFAVETLAVRGLWLGLRWPVALAVDLGVFLAVSAAVRSDVPPQQSPWIGAIGIGLALPLLYLSSIGTRTLAQQRQITPFELVQAPLALLVGFSGALRVVAFQGVDPTGVRAVIILLGAACYAAAFASIDRRLGRGRNFYSCTTLAGLLVLVGTYLVLPAVPLALTWSALAVAAVWLGGRFDRITLKFHGALYAVAAAIVAGLVACAFDGLLAHPAATWRPLTPICLAVALAAATCYGILVATARNTAPRWPELLPQALVGALLVWSLAGIAAPWLAQPLVAASSSDADVAFLAASRTVVIALSAVALAWVGRRWLLQELTWLVYPLLVGGAIKLLWVDFRHGQPVTLFVALAVYGSALIFTPRWIRKES